MKIFLKTGVKLRSVQHRGLGALVCCITGSCAKGRANAAHLFSLIPLMKRDMLPAAGQQRARGSVYFAARFQFGF